METLKRVIIYGSCALTLICVVSALVFAIFDAIDIALVAIFSGIPMFLIFCISRMLWDEYDDDGNYYQENSTEPEPETKPEKKTIVITDTRCSACGAPLEDEVCRYCGTRAVIYKTIT